MHVVIKYIYVYLITYTLLQYRADSYKYYENCVMALNIFFDILL